MSRIPLVDLKAQYGEIKSEIEAAIRETIENTAFIMGDRVVRLEEEFAEYVGVPFAVATSSGTTALHLALVGCGIAPGHEVITVSHTFIATAEAICHCGATPVFIDVEAETYNMNPELIERAITPKTKAILPVHLYGQCADVQPILDIARRHELEVIEDCAQAHGAECKGRAAGSIGNAGCFSFFPGKNLGAFGDAGMITTRDEALARRLRMLSNHGRKEKYIHEMIGYNYRLDALQAAILRVKLRRLPGWTEARRRLAHRYNELLRDVPVETPMEREKHVYHLYVIQCENRDELALALKEREIDTGIHYPVPLHLQPCFRHLASWGKGKLPVTEKIASRVLSLPLYPELTDDQQDQIVDAIRQFYT